MIDLITDRERHTLTDTDCQLLVAGVLSADLHDN